MPKGKPRDLTGEHFHLLTVRGRDPEKKNHWICDCNCGGIKSIRGDSLVTNNTKSCGCLIEIKRDNEAMQPGAVFGPWTILGRERNDKKHVFWRCQCVCGSIEVRRTDGLLDQKNAEPVCICRKKKEWQKFQEETGEAKMVGTEHITENEYAAWCAMKTRCRNEDAVNYDRYGGRGITVCEGLFRSCLHWIKCVGRKPEGNYTLNRPRNDDGYWCGECDDCQANGWTKNLAWATKSEQGRNKRNTRWLTHEGKTLSMAEWSERKGISHCTILYRIDKAGWSVADALDTPAGQRRPS